MISRENILKLETRQKIYRYISENPGVHLREIQRKTNIPYGTLKHHLRYLEKHKLIKTKSLVGYYKRYAITDKFSKNQTETLNLMRQEVPRYILIYILFYRVCSQTELAKALEKKPSTIGFHLKKFKKIGLIIKLDKNTNFDTWKLVIKRSRKTSESLYTFSTREMFYDFYDMLIVHKNSLPDQKLIDDILHNYLDCIDKSREDKAKRDFPDTIYKRNNTPDVGIDNAINLFYELFPNPYCC
jgi:DNA-binding transcriptional ArsR family regulator